MVDTYLNRDELFTVQALNPIDPGHLRRILKAMPSQGRSVLSGDLRYVDSSCAPSDITLSMLDNTSGCLVSPLSSALLSNSKPVSLDKIVDVYTALFERQKDTSKELPDYLKYVVGIFFGINWQLDYGIGNVDISLLPLQGKAHGEYDTPDLIRVCDSFYMFKATWFPPAISALMHKMDGEYKEHCYRFSSKPFLMKFELTALEQDSATNDKTEYSLANLTSKLRAPLRALGRLLTS